MGFYRMICRAWQTAGRVSDKLFRHGCDFSRWVSHEEIGFSEEEGNQYQPVSRSLNGALRHYSVTENDNIIDMGCGKGKAMYMMSKFPFGRIGGYDLSQELVDIANHNFAKLKLEQCRAVFGNATEFNDYDEYNYFYLFNSFPEAVFARMMEKVMESLERKPRKCVLIYCNPVCHQYLLDHTPFRVSYEKKSVISWFICRCYETEETEINRNKRTLKPGEYDL